MIRLGTIFWAAVVGVLGFATFAVTYSVQGLEDDLLRVRKQTVVEQQEMRTLEAEWTYLTQPGRLEELNQRFLSLASISPQQLSRTIADIPMRPIEPPPPAVAAVDTTVPAAVAREVKRPAETAATRPAAERPPETETVAVKPAVARAPAKAAAPRSLDELFAQVAGER
ncbi:MAG TPA: hypothetical protein VFA12_01035 [Stellaceae bacterium]|nr:hypothetical protein [Stellaceae bacterium]